MNKLSAASTIISCIFLLSFAGGVSAEMKTGAVSISPHVGGYLFDGDQDLKNRPIYGLGVGYNLSERWGVEASLGAINTEFDVTGDDVNAYLFRLEGLYHFNITDRFVPYVAAGVGDISLSPDNGSTKNSPVFDYGAGVKYFLTEDIALRGDVRHVIAFDSRDTINNNLLYTVGLSFSFGGGKAVAAAAPTPEPAPAPAPKPAPKAVTAPAPEPKDSDGDGIYDDKDKCPDTPSGARVDDRGCWVLKNVLFDFDKAIIKPEGRPILDEVAAVLKNNPSMRFDIEGHTDSTGPIRWNQGLSERRARAVIEYLVSAGIDPNRLTAKGFGESRPIATNETREGRALNRRVESSPTR